MLPPKFPGFLPKWKAPFVTVNRQASIIYNVIVVASNDNESSQVTLPRFSICAPVPAIRGLTRFVTMAEVAEVEDGVVIIDCVVIFNKEGEGGEHYRKKNKFRCRVKRIEKRLVKLKEKIW